MSQLLLLCKHIQTRTRRNENLAYIEYCFPIKVGFLYHYNFQLMSITEGCSSSSFDAVMKHTCIIMPFCFFFLISPSCVCVCVCVCLRRWWRFPRCLSCAVFSFAVRASNVIILQCSESFLCVYVWILLEMKSQRLLDQGCTKKSFPLNKFRSCK